MEQAESPEQASSWRKAGRRQKYLVQEQKARVQQFVQERTAVLLSGAAIDEQAVEYDLSQAYQVAGLKPPVVRWFASPLEFLRAHYLPFEQHILQDDVELRVQKGRGTRKQKPANNHIVQDIERCLRQSLPRELIRRLQERVYRSVYDYVVANQDDKFWLEASRHRWQCGAGDLNDYLEDQIQRGVRGLFYLERSMLWHLCHELYQESELIHFARFSEAVYGYRLGASEAWVVQNALRCSFDEHGRLHNEYGACIEFRDGWQIYAWHGVVVPAHVILSPEKLTREDWLTTSDIEVRRVIQEMMPDFVEQLGGRFLDSGTRGCLYAIDLPGDPEKVAHYVQVSDNSTGRIYYLRVPPSLTHANEAVAWTFGLSEQEYQPEQET
ncbi:MAG TPA: hypothetical protein VFN35_32985 [Ktedonobacteraceae bacterium]|nr:hypothetical protein [Ktedonobacteraceae bacterium]